MGPPEHRQPRGRVVATRLALALLAAAACSMLLYSQTRIGVEVAIARHLADGEEATLPLARLLQQGQQLFTANWTAQEGGGRPLTKGTGAALSDSGSELRFPRNFNRLSGPDANSCAGCHNAPFGIAGGGGDIVANVFVLGQRFDFVTFDGSDPLMTRGTFDEAGKAVTLGTLANSRITIGMFGSGYIEMLARQMTAEMQAIRDATLPGSSRPLVTKGVSFGVIARLPDGRWDTSRVEGLAAPSLATAGASSPPSLIVRPFHQAGNVISLRQFTEGTSRRSLLSALWARFAQPARLVMAADDAAATAVERALSEAVVAMAAAALPLLPARFDAAALWQSALAATYGAELRSEGSERAAELYAADRSRYDAVTPHALEELAAAAGYEHAGPDPAGRFTTRLPGAMRRRGRWRWRLRRPLGKLLNLLRLIKGAVTFSGGLDYILWKVERHSGVRVTVSPWQRRHPLLGAPAIAWRLYRRGGFR